MPSTSLCTIIAKNYVAAARTLCRSWREHHPDAECYVLVVDETEGFLDAAHEPFTLIRLPQLSLSAVEQMAFKYSVVELCTAVKPFLMDYLLRVHPVDRLVYLDPDILVTASLESVLATLDDEGADMLLTPHLDSAACEQEASGMDSHLMVHGTFNLGFLAISSRPAAQQFLIWFQGKLRDKCVNDSQRGFFVDQKFIDYALGIFRGFRIVWDPGCNVAPWNAPTRRLSLRDGAWLCNGVPLRFFHFSTFKPVGSSPPECQRFAEREDARPLFEAYRQALLTNGYVETRPWPYTYGRFTTGGTIPPALRRHYRDALDSGTNPSDDPFRSRWLAALSPLCRMEEWVRYKITRAGVHWDRLCARVIRRSTIPGPTG